MTYEGYIKVKATDGRISRSIQKPVAPDGKPTNDTNLSKSCWEGEGDKHILDVWKLDNGRLKSIRNDAENAQESILLRKVRGKRKASSQASKGKKRARTDYTARVVSDSDF
jgi:hypothetical protein